MKNQNIINKLKESGLKGRSGCNFPTGLKWEMVKKAKAKKKYIICNASEGEPNAFKDEFILKNYPDEVIEGIKIALKTFNNSSAYIYLRKDYFRKFKKKLEKLIKNSPIMLLKKPDGYLAGEETSILEFIEGKRPEPRIKPPFPTTNGLWGYPTLINNVETLYSVAQIFKGKYQKNRFYCLSGDIKNPGVFQFTEDYPISKILKETDNWPNFDPIINKNSNRVNFFCSGGRWGSGRNFTT